MLFIKEILHRKLNFFFTLLGVIVAVSIFVSFYTLTKASWNETRLLTRDMGFNLRIIPQYTDMNSFWINGYSDDYMPEEYIQRLIDQRSVDYAHLTASLHKKVTWHDQEIILSGLANDELEPRGTRKSKMIFSIPPDKVTLGYEIATKNHIHEGDSVRILNKAFIADKILSETGSNDDIRMYFNLNDLQVMLNMPGMINEIMALNCMCSTKSDNPLQLLREELARVIPEAKVVMNSTIAVARERQRKMGDKYFNLLVPLLLIASMIWIAIVSLNNVNNRLKEIGILAALGFGSGRIAIVFFARAALAGILGALFGYLIGTELAISMGPQIFKVAPHSVKVIPALLSWSILGAPVFACISSFIPIMWAISRDAATILKQE
ncbi:MAG: ABC transporter permease [Bacteroidales bacterium]|nr:ABC transporter permease [Bacteroidales bacterium]